MMKKRNIHKMHFCTNLENKMVFSDSVLDFYLINKTFKEEKLKKFKRKNHFSTLVMNAFKPKKYYDRCIVNIFMNCCHSPTKSVNIWHIISWGNVASFSTSRKCFPNPIPYIRCWCLSEIFYLNQLHIEVIILLNANDIL